jgi:hypothetical protein
MEGGVGWRRCDPTATQASAQEVTGGGGLGRCQAMAMGGRGGDSMRRW